MKAKCNTFAGVMVDDLGYMLIQHSDELQLLRTRWKPGYSSQHLKHALLHVLEVATQHNLTQVVLDFHDLPDIGMLEQAWISMTWFPKMAALPLQQLGLVMPPRSLYNQMVVESILWIGQPLINFDIHYFSEVEDALDWITAESPQLSVVRQEWEHAKAISNAAQDKHYLDVTCS